MDVQQINARLLADPDDDELRVLADALEAIGDPRGEWIAHQLAGTPIAQPYGLAFERGWFTLQFLYLTAPYVDWEPFAPWIREIRVRSAGELFERFLEDLCRACPYLETLALHVDGPNREGESCDAIQWALDVAPRLRTFELECDNTRIRPLSHPHVRRLHAIGGTAADVLLPPGWTQVTELAFEPTKQTDQLDLVRMPALRTLDLSCNEPPHGVFDVVALVEAELEHLHRLELLRLPAIRNGTSFERLVRIREALPDLRIEITRAYARYKIPPAPPGITLPRVVTWSPPWTPRLQLYLGENRIEMRPLLSWLDAAHATMSPEALDAWLAIFRPFDPMVSRRWSIAPEVVAAAMSALPASSPLRASTDWHMLCSRYPSIGSM